MATPKGNRAAVGSDNHATPLPRADGSGIIDRPPSKDQPSVEDGPSNEPILTPDPTTRAANDWERWNALALGHLDGVEAVLADHHRVIDDCVWDIL